MKIRTRLILLSILIASAGAFLLDRSALLLAQKTLIEGALPSLADRLPLLLIIVSAIALLAGLVLVRVERIRQPMSRMTRAVELVASGQHGQPIDREDTDMGRLGSAVDRMRTTLVEQINTSETARRLLGSILSELREGILVVNPDRKVLLINGAFKSSMGIDRWIPEGSRLIDAVWDHTMLEVFDRALKDRVEVRQQVRTRGDKSFELTVTPFSDASGNHAGAIGLLFDVTRLEALERVRREFVADISHELRTPLASVKASVETLQGGAMKNPEDARKFMRILVKNAGRMEDILSDLTDLSLIETDAVQMTLAPMNLASSMREVMESLALKVATRSLDVDIRIPPDITLNADRRRFEQILVNLIDNAIKFSPRGGTILIEAQRSDGRVVLKVADSGPGIPPDALDRVFNRFYQVNRARDRQIPGTGLGLAIVKHLIQKHGGDVSASNRDEGGAVFTLEIPLPPK